MHPRCSTGWLILGLAAGAACMACARPAAPPQPASPSTDDLDVEPVPGAARAGAAEKAEEIQARVSLAPRYPDRALLVVESNREEIMECRRHDLALRLVRTPEATPEATIEAVLDGACVGACTPEDKQAGEAALAEAQARVAAGDSESILDHDFTGCVFHGSELGRVEAQAGRALVLLVGHEPGPHDIPHRHFRLATAVCDRVFVSQPFGGTYANRWALEDLHLTAGEGGAVIVTARDQDAGVEVYRVTFPAEDCAAPPVEQVGDAEAG